MNSVDRYWKQEVIVQVASREDLVKIYKVANGTIVNLGNGDAVITVQPKGGMRVLTSAFTSR